MSQRLGHRSLMELVFAIALFATPSCADRDDDEPVVPEETAETAADLEPWVAQAGKIHRPVDGPMGAIATRLDVAGRLMVRSDDEWTRVTLDGLGEVLIAAVKREAPVAKADVDEIMAARSVVEIDVSDAPWRNVCWVIRVCFEHNFNKIRLVRLGGAVDLVLPWRSSVPRAEIPERQRVEIGISRAGDGTGEVTYRAGTRSAEDVDAVRAYCAQAREELDVTGIRDPLVAVLLVDPGVAADAVVAVMRVLLEAGVDRIDCAFLKRMIPSDADRRIEALPYPPEGGK